MILFNALIKRCSKRCESMVTTFEGLPLQQQKKAFWVWKSAQSVKYEVKSGQQKICQMSKPSKQIRSEVGKQLKSVWKIQKLVFGASSDTVLLSCYLWTHWHPTLISLLFHCNIWFIFFLILLFVYCASS